MKNSSKITVKNIPNDTTQEEVDNLIRNYGNVLLCELLNVGNEKSMDVTFESHPAALKALEHLQSSSFKGQPLQVELAGVKVARRTSVRIINNTKKPHPFLHRIPLKMLVSTQYVGAIIGKGGACVKQITTKCKARIDVHSKDTAGGAEKVLSIYGQSDNRTETCKEVLLVLCREGAFPSDGDVVLKLLAGDQYSGRLIGKEGKNIKMMRDKCNAKINIVVTHELSSFYPDRVVLVRGSVDEVVAAEALISKKLAFCYEADAANNPAFINNAYHASKPYKGMNNFCEPTMQHQKYHHPAYGGSNGAYGDGFGPATLPQVVEAEVLRVAVPESAVGALIGSGGAVIKQMMRASGAFLSIERKEERASASEERSVCIKGGVEACCRALYSVFERMRLEGFSGPGESRLKVMVAVPLESVGRLIGKGGCNIRSLQKVTGAIVRVVPAATGKVGEEDKEDRRQEGDGSKTPTQAIVLIYGNFSAVLNAHMRIRSVVQQVSINNLYNLNNNSQKPQRNKL